LRLFVNCQPEIIIPIVKIKRIDFDEGLELELIEFEVNIIIQYGWGDDNYKKSENDYKNCMDCNVRFILREIKKSFENQKINA
jgi:hypothetical protein